MATSEDLLHVDPNNAYSSLIIKKEKNLQTLKEERRPIITRLEAPSVLSRARDFLPLIASANQNLEQELKQKSLSAFDIEDVDERKGYIEMNIGLFARDNEQNETSSSVDSDSDISNEDYICRMLGEVTEKNIKIRKEETTKHDIIKEISNEKTAKHHNTRAKQKRQDLKKIRKNGKRKKGK